MKDNGSNDGSLLRSELVSLVGSDDCLLLGSFGRWFRARIGKNPRRTIQELSWRSEEKRVFVSFR